MTAPEIPPNVVDLAIDHHLGKPVAVWVPRRIGWFAAALNLVLGVALIPVGLGIWLLWHVFRSPTFNKKRAAHRIYVYDDGFVLATDPNAPEAWRWDDIDTIFKEIHRSSAGQLIKQTFYSYTLTRIDGRVIKLDAFWQNMGELGYHISIKTACAKLPQMRAALAAGREVAFGTIAVSVHGIRNGTKTVPWSEVVSVDLPDNRFSVKVRGRFALFAVTAVRDIPNLRLLEMLAEDLRTGGVELEGDIARA